MIAAEDRKSRIPKVVQILTAHYLGSYKLQLRFDDGHESTVDFGPFLKSSEHPSIRAYLDVGRFQEFALQDGMLQWNDFDLVFPMAELYEGKIEV